jgi:transcription antitermination factor NusG
VSSAPYRLNPESEAASSYTARRDKNVCWYAVRVQSKLDSLASATLRGKGYEEFLPLYRSRRRWSDRVKELDLPLFPGYLFCRFDVENRLPILTTPGVIKIVGAGKTPIAVSDDEIAAVQAVVRSGLPAMPWPCLTVGSRILIEGGPLSGLEGIALNVDRKYRLVVSVPLLQRAVAVEIEREWARPILQGTGCRAVPMSERLRVLKAAV